MSREILRHEKGAKTSKELDRHLIFSLGEESYGIPLLSVKEVIAVPKTTSVPRAPSYFEGIMNLRGQVIPIIDLRKKLSIKPNENSSENAVIIVDLDPILVGVVVDSVDSVLLFEQDLVSPVPEMEKQLGGEHLTSVARKDEKLILILDVRKLIGVEDLETIKKAA